MIVGFLTLAADTINAENLTFLAAPALHSHGFTQWLPIQRDGLCRTTEQVDGRDAVEQDRCLVDLYVGREGRAETELQLDMSGGLVRPVAAEPVNAKPMKALREAEEFVQDAVAIHLLAGAGQQRFVCLETDEGH